MPLTIDLPNGKRSRDLPHRVPPSSPEVTIGLINNMPDAALEATQVQFERLLQAASGLVSVCLRHSWLPDVPRKSAAVQRLQNDYWPLAAASSHIILTLRTVTSVPKCADC